jgi:predicted permease
VEGYQPRPGEDLGSSYAILSPDYFKAMRIPLLEGRDFDDNDTMSAARVAIVNEEVVRRFWPGQSAIGRRFRILGDREVTVVGVVRSGKYRSLSEPPRMFVYLPYLQGVWDLNLGVVLRSSGALESLIPALRREIREMDPAVEVWAALPTVDFIQAAFLPQRIAAVLLAVLSAVALILATMGIFGLMTYMVSQRTHEIGIRMALGAEPRSVLVMVLRRGAWLTGLGGVVGLLGAVALGRLLSSFLYGVSPFDPATFVGVLAVLGGVSLLACLIPARRAAQVDPVIALRHE